MPQTTYGLPCAFHHEEIITNFCKSEHCLLPLCPKCIKLHVDEHDDQDSFAEIESIDTSLKEVDEVFGRLQHMLTKSGQQLSEILTDKEKVKDVIASRFRQAKARMIKEFQRSIDKIEKSVLKQVSDFTEKVGMDLRQVDESLRQIFNKVLKNVDQLNSERCLKSLILFHSTDYVTQLYKQLQECQNAISQIKQKKFDLLIDQDAVARVRRAIQTYTSVATNDIFLKESTHVAKMDRPSMRQATKRLSVLKEVR